MRPLERHGSRGDEGIALVLTLLFVVLLTALVVDFAYEMQVEASLVGTRNGSFEAEIAAKSAVAAGLAALSADVLIAENQGSGEIYDSLDEPWAEGAPLTRLNDAYAQVTISDEFGKINLNALIISDDGQNQQNAQRAEALKTALLTIFQIRGAEVDPVPAIIDWLDEDDDTELNGAENDYYESLTNPYECKNGPMDSLEELLLIPGITPEVYFGDPEQDLLPLSELLTVHGHPEGKVNANTAPYDILVAMWGSDGSTSDPEGMATDMFNRIENIGPYQSERDLPQAGPNLAFQKFDVASEVFRVRGEGQSGENLVRVEAFVHRATKRPDASQMFRVLDWRVTR